MTDIEAVNAVISQEDGQDESDRGTLELQAADLRPLGVVQLEQLGTNKGNLLFGKILAIGHDKHVYFLCIQNGLCYL